MSRKKIIAGNWKMHMTIEQAQQFFHELSSKLPTGRQLEYFIAPPFTALYPLLKEFKNTKIMIGAQNMHNEDKGAFTGEISPPMLTDLGVHFVILGHSERRHVFNESDSFIHKKVLAALQHKLKVILCIGETEQQRENNETKKVLSKQLTEGLKDLSNGDMDHIIIAYEPVWAIGTGKTATPEIAESAHKFVRDELEKLFSSGVAQQVSILYGGSVKPDNIAELSAQENIDGALIGGASLKADSYLEIIQHAKD